MSEGVLHSNAPMSIFTPTINPRLPAVANNGVNFFELLIEMFQLFNDPVINIL